MKKAKDENISVQRRSTQRKSYSSPKLSNFGTVALLTQATMMTNGNDGSGIMNSMSVS